MHVPRLKAAALLGGLLLASVTPARADIFVSPFAGVKFRGATNPQGPSIKNGAEATKSSIGISGILVADSGPGFELDIGHQSRFFERDSGTSLVTRSGVTTLSGNLMLAVPQSITRESLRPYVVVGLGWMHASAVNGIGLNPLNNDYLGLTLGGGAIGFLTDVVGVRFDLRRIRSVSSADTSAISQEIARLSFWRASIGLVFR